VPVDRKQIVILAAAAVVCGAMLLVHWPLYRKMVAIKTARAVQSELIAKGSAQESTMVNLEAELTRLQERTADFRQRIPSEPMLGWFLQQIADLMEACRLEDQVVVPGQEIAADVVHCVPVKMQCKGRLHQIFEFFEKLQTLQRLVRIERVRLQNDPHYTGKVSLEAEAVLYYQPEKRMASVGL